MLLSDPAEEANDSLPCQITQHDHLLLSVRNLLAPQECDALVELSESVGFDEAAMNGRTTAQIYKQVRNNDRAFYNDVGLAETLWRRLQRIMPMQYFHWTAVGVNELFRFYRYDPGQRFVWHQDGAYQRENGERSHVTVLFYLNEVELGGETSFKELRITPEKGMACLFLHNYLHQGDEVLRGRKYVMRTDVMYRDLRTA